MVISSAASTRTTSTSRCWRREFIIVIGLTSLIQFALYGTSFLGNGVLSPVHILSRPGLFQESHYHGQPIPSYVRSDLIQVTEPFRWFMAAEYRAGRIPLWTPYAFGGTSFARAPLFSPFELLYVLWPDPKVLPWIHLASACVGATGMWWLAAKMIGLSPIAAVTAGVAYPLTGFVVLWQGFDLTYPVLLFPWEVFAALSLIRNPSIPRMIVLAIVTALTIVSGQVDMAALVLLTTGIVWVWAVLERIIASRQWQPMIGPIVLTACGWGLGILLTAPLLLPLAEYLQSSSRVAVRNSGFEARPPVGWKALPLIVFPEAYGLERDDTAFVLQASGNQLESAAGSYFGCVAFLFALPWAWLDRTRRSWVWRLTAFAILGLSWQLSIPGLVDFWRLPGLKLFSANRLVFLTAWSALLLASIGLEQISLRCSSPFTWTISWGAVATIVCLAGCVAGLALWPAELNQIQPKGLRGLSNSQILIPFLNLYWHQLGWCLACCGCWGAVMFGPVPQRWFTPLVSLLMILDLMAHAWNLHPQPNASLYFPRLPALEFIQQSPPGRVIGIDCLPPRVLESHQLADIRGYDGVDPQPIIDILEIASSSKIPRTSYAQTMWYRPLFAEDKKPGGTFRLHPTLDMLGVRYVIFGEPQPDPAFQGGGYTVLVNKHAMPRVWVPSHVQEETSEISILRSISTWEFFPSKFAYVTNRPTELPKECSGDVELTEENPQQLAITATMQTPGLVVIGDRFDSGWRATVDGQPADIRRVNYLLRGVEVPEGVHTIELRYQPISFVRGCQISLAAATTILLMAGWSCRRLFAREKADRQAASP